MASTAVRHKLYGVGEITEQTENKIRVRFGENVGEKSFQYPEVFFVHLRYEDPQMQRTVEEELHEREAANRQAAEERESLRLENIAAEKLRQKQMAAAKKRSGANRSEKNAKKK